jgi:hypothetical protein
MGTTNASRQLVTPTTPITGIATTHAVGAPTSVQATTRPRFTSSLQAAAAATPAATRIDEAAPVSACPAASTNTDGATRLVAAPTTSSTMPTDSIIRSRTRAVTAPTASAAAAATTADTVRICPAAAVETPNARAASVSTGVSANWPL